MNTAPTYVPTFWKWPLRALSLRVQNSQIDNVHGVSRRNRDLVWGMYFMLGYLDPDGEWPRMCQDAWKASASTRRRIHRRNQRVLSPRVASDTLKLTRAEYLGPKTVHLAGMVDFQIQILAPPPQLSTIFVPCNPI